MILHLDISLHSARSIVTFTDPGTWNASMPASIFATGMTPGEGIVWLS